MQRPSLVDGKIPKDSYGGIEVWGPHSIPEGTVHIPLPRLANICKKMGIDYAPAMVGYNRQGIRVTAVYEVSFI
jgi:xeroderma pigmentosum group C-complementing protein